MKKILLPCFVMLSTYLSVLAQPVFGVKAGMTVVNLHGKNQVFTSRQKTYGWTVGVYSKVKLNNKFSFVPELQFARREYDILGFTSVVNVSCLQLNALVSYAPVKQIAIEAGPYFGQRIGISSHFNDKTFAATAFNKKGELGMSAGLRLRISNSFTLTSRIIQGITPVSDSDLRDDMYRPMGNFTQYCRVAELAVVYKIVGSK